MNRQLTSDSVIQSVRDLIRTNEKEKAFRTLGDALKVSRKPDYFWFRGWFYEDMGNASNAVSEKRDNYKNAIADYRRTAQLDPSMFLVQGLIWPETTWAVPAYTQLLTYSRGGDGPIAVSKETQVRRKAANALARIGTGAREALDALESALAEEENPDKPNAAAAMKTAVQNIKMSHREIEEVRSSMKIDTEALRRLSEHEFVSPRGGNVVYADDLDWDSDLSLTDLLQRVGTSEVAIRAKALCFIGAKKEGSLDTCKTIASGLADKKAIIRCLSAYALGQIASVNKTATSGMNLVPTLLRLLKSDKSVLVRKSAAEVLGEVGSGSTEALQGLIQVVANGYDRKDDKYRRVEITAIEALGHFGEAALAAVPYIRQFGPAGHMNRNGSLVVKYEALLRIALNDREIVEDALPQLIGYSRCPDEPAVRLRAINALGTVQPDKMKRVMALVKSLWMDESAENRHAAAEALLKIDHELAVKAGVLEAGELMGRFG